MKIFYTLLFLLFLNNGEAQNFNGQWKGGFNETSYGYVSLGGSQIDYVLELQTSGANVSGYSYTYFREGGQRYFTICKLTGTLNRSKKEIIVTETERVKYNTPPNFLNCFQTHKLHYERAAGDSELLRGSWVPAPNQTGNCGSGRTVLSRRVVKKLPMGIASVKKPETKTETRKPAMAKTSPPKGTKPDIASTPKNVPPAKENKKEEKEDISQKTIIGDKNLIPAPPPPVLKNRRKDIIKVIPIEQRTFRVDFYDNGEIDGDSISVIYNGKVILSNRKLTDKPLTLNLTIDDDEAENVITMYADNLGTIPPNTALMVVTDGDKRYEVRITSDTEKSGSVVFEHKK